MELFEIVGGGDIICRSKLKRNFIDSSNRGWTDGRSGLILRSVDLHTTTTLFYFKKVTCVLYSCTGSDIKESVRV